MGNNKRILFCLALCAVLLVTAGAQAQTRSKWAHAYRYGDRTEARVAITVDDWYEPNVWLPQFMAVAEEYGVKLTLYPSGFNLKVEDREYWQAALDAGHVIGCHFFQHRRLTERSFEQVLKDLEKYENTLDEVLGYHYEFYTVRPPFGAGLGQGGSSPVGRWIHSAGFDHIVLWDMDNTSNLKYALSHIKNGSIILLHANGPDLKFFRSLMEGLKDRNYEYVTVHDLLHINSRYYYVD